MNRITYTIGQGFDQHNKPLTDVAGMRANALADVARTFGGYTTHESSGGWIDPSGHLVTEPSLEVIVITDKPEQVIQTEAHRLASTFDQTSVMLTEEPIQASFIGQ